jgi:PAS domain S-box-containing protein
MSPQSEKGAIGATEDDLSLPLADQAARNAHPIEALRLAEQKYRSIFEHATEGIFQTSLDGHYLSANPALAQIYGYSSPEELLTALVDISRQLYVQPDRRAEFILAMRQNGIVAAFESQVYRRDGSIIWISENAHAVRDEVTGELLYYEGMVQDITSRKQAEEARLRAEARKAAQYAVTHTLAGSSRLVEAAPEILRAVCQSLEWDVGDLWLADREIGALRCFDVRYAPQLDAAELEQAARRLTFKPGVGLAGRAWETGQAVWTGNLVEERNFTGRMAIPELRSAAAFPILLGAETIGVLEFFSRQKREPDEDLSSMMLALGALIGQFIERERIANQLARYTDELRAKNSQLEADLEMARDIQQVFLTQRYPNFPRSSTPEESSLRFCHWYQPAERVGGDFFCVLPVSDTEAGLFICDVVGHGLRAALVTAIVRGLVEELAPIATDPGRLLGEINRSLLAIFRQTETPMLVSAFYLVLSLVDGQMRYASAGHPHPLHVRREARLVEPLRLNGFPGPVLGIFDEARYKIGNSNASANDLIMLFTDGLFEVEVAANNEYYGEERLLAAVRERMHLPVARLFVEVVAEIRNSCVSGRFGDDVCLLGMEVVRTGLADSSRKIA